MGGESKGKKVARAEENHFPFKNALIIHKENTKEIMFNACLYI